MAKRENTITIYKDCVTGKSKNRRLLVRPSENGESIIIQFSIMDGITKSRSVHFLSHKNKVVNTGVMIGKDTAQILYEALRYMIADYDSFYKNYPKKEDSHPTQ